MASGGGGYAGTRSIQPNLVVDTISSAGLYETRSATAKGEGSCGNVGHEANYNVHFGRHVEIRPGETVG